MGRADKRILRRYQDVVPELMQDAGTPWTRCMGDDGDLSRLVEPSFHDREVDERDGPNNPKHDQDRHALALHGIRKTLHHGLGCLAPNVVTLSADANC